MWRATFARLTPSERKRGRKERGSGVCSLSSPRILSAMLSATNSTRDYAERKSETTQAASLTVWKVPAIYRFAQKRTRRRRSLEEVKPKVEFRFRKILFVPSPTRSRGV